jgi:stage II sporulation protein D
MAVGRVAGPQRLKSTSFDLRRTAGGYTFAGRGFGHGVGLCVIGAGRRAAAGASADEILGFYYPGLRIEQWISASSRPSAGDATVVASQLKR